MKPAAVRGQYMKGIVLSATMSPGVRVADLPISAVVSERCPLSDTANEEHNAMSKYVKTCYRRPRQRLATFRRAAGEHDRPDANRTLRCGRSCAARISTSWWSRTAWPPGQPRDALGAAVRGLAGTAAICWGQRRHRQLGQGDHQTGPGHEVRPLRLSVAASWTASS